MADEKACIKPELIGSYCIAEDDYYGTYKGIILSTRNVPFGSRVDVSIMECIEPPTNKAILNPYGTVKRKPYPLGSRQHFSADKVTPLLEVTA